MQVTIDPFGFRLLQHLWAAIDSVDLLAPMLGQLFTNKSCAASEIEYFGVGKTDSFLASILFDIVADVLWVWVIIWVLAIFVVNSDWIKVLNGIFDTKASMLFHLPDAISSQRIGKIKFLNFFLHHLSFLFILKFYILWRRNSLFQWDYWGFIYFYRSF